LAGAHDRKGKRENGDTVDTTIIEIITAQE
jgi:hypothetical protein